jgi:hypothetical protein
MSDIQDSGRFTVSGSTTDHIFEPQRAQSEKELISSLSSPNATNLIFRGQSNIDWPLESNLERSISLLGAAPEQHRFIENVLVGEFKRRAKAVLPTTPINDDVLGWLALMQHYRAPTRLLDWTESPFVALFFAIRDLDESTDAALWILDPKKCLALHPSITMQQYWDNLGTRDLTPGAMPSNSDGLPPVHSYDDEQNFRLRTALATQSPWPLPLMPDWQDQRMAAQQSVFTAVGSDNHLMGRLLDVAVLNAEVQAEFPAGFTELQEEFQPLSGNPLLLRVAIKGEWKNNLMVSLHLMGISNLSLFPGPDGLGEFAKQRVMMNVPLREWLAGRTSS